MYSKNLHEIKWRWNLLLLSFILITTIKVNAQTSLGASDVTIPNGDGTPMAVAWHPGFQRYYASTGGGPANTVATSTSAGVSVASTSHNFDNRGLWWNPNSSRLEGSNYQATIIGNYPLNASGTPSGNVTNIITGSFSTNGQAGATYNSQANEYLIPNGSGVVRRYSASGVLLGTITVTVPAGSNFYQNHIAYTGISGRELGFFDYTNKRLYTYPLSGGTFAHYYQLPASAPAPNSWGFSYANGRIFLTTSNGGGTWLGYLVQASCTPPTITSTTSASRCGSGTVTLAAATSAGTINWYSAASGGTSLGTGTSFTTPSITATTTYYVDATASGCTSARTQVTATVNPIPVTPINLSVSKCGSGIVHISPVTQSGLVFNLDAASYSGTGNTWADISSNANNGVLNNVTYATANGGYFNFNGTTSNVLMGSLLPNGASYTFESWVYRNNTTGSQNIISTNNAPFWFSGSTLAAGIAGNYSVVSVPNSTINTWMHVAVTFNDATNTMTLYLNGVQIAQATNVTATYDAQNIYLGAHSDGNGLNPGSSLNGRMSHARVYNRALSASEMSYNFDITRSRYLTPGTIVNWFSSATGGLPIAYNSSLFSPSPSGSNTYFVETKDSITGCLSSGRGTVNVTVSSNTFGLSDTISTCGDSVLLDGGSGFTNYTWSNGATTQTTWAKHTGKLYLTVSGGACPGTYTDSINVTIPKVAIQTKDTTICAGSPLTIRAVQKNALDFDGTNDYVSLPSGVYFNDNTFTVETWVYVRSYNNWSRIFDFGAGPINHNVLAAISDGTSGTFRFETYSGTTQASYATVAANTSIPLNTWTHVACVLNGSNASIYFNGNLVGSGTLPAPSNVTRTNNYIGRSNWAADAYSNMQLDEFRIWNVARSQAQIRSAMNSELVGNEIGLITYLDFDQGQASSSNTGLNTVSNGANASQAATLSGFALSGASSNYVSGPAVLANTNPTWSNGGSTSSISVNPISNTTYTYSETKNGVICSKSMNVTVVNAPTATATAAGSTSLCTGGSVVINSNTGTGLTYQWLNNNAPIASATNAAYTANAAGSYRVLVTNAAGCKDTSTAVVVVVNAIPTITSSTPASRCGTGTVSLTAASSAGTINWYAAATGGTSLATGTSFTTPSISATTTYYVDATANGCTTATRTAVAATVNALPTATATAAGSTNLCTGGSVIINANTGTGLTYQWLNNNAPIASATNAAYTANAAGSYRVLVNNGSCSDTSTAVAVVVNAIPTITSSTPASRCGTGTVSLTAAASAGTINWYSAATGGTSLATGTSFTTPSISATTTYYVDATANGCTTATRTAVAATVNALPTATATAAGSTSLCTGGSVVINANTGTGLTYQWLNNNAPIASATNAAYTANAAGSYRVLVTNANSCKDTSTAVAVVVNAIPTITSSTPASRCGTGTVSLAAAASAGTINWYAAATGGTSLATGTSFTTPSISATTTYYVDATANGCTTATRTAVAATVNALPTATATAAGSTSLCTGGSVVINANTGTGLTYQWLNNNAPIASATNAAYTANAAGSYRVLVTNAAGCKDTSTAVAVVVNTIPTITSSTPASRCGTGTLSLTAAASAGTINWYSAATGGTSLATGTNYTTPSITTTTTYYVDATANGCTTATRTAVIATVNPNLTASVSISSNTTSICGSAPITFTATPTNGGTTPSYQWKKNGVNVGTNSDTYVLNNALNGDSVYVVMTSNATPCLVNTTANSNGIKLTSSTVTPTVAVTANPGNVICNGTSVTFTANATNGGSTPAYQWKRNGVNVGTNASTFVTSLLSTNDSISVVLTSNASCLSTSTATSLPVVMTVNSIPTITSSTPASRCGTGTVALTAAASAGTINWYSAATGGTSLATGTSFTTPSISATTTYYVDATANGCTTATRTAVAATVNTIPTITSSTPASRCGTGTVSLTAVASAGTINWYNAATGGTSLATGTSFTTPSISATTTYYVDATANGCTTATRTAVAATVNAIPTITSSTPASRCGTGTVSLTAAASAGTINWYAAATGGTSLATGISFTTPSISATTTYYVDASANGCTTASRTSIAATVNAKPLTSAISGRTTVHSDTVETYAVTNTTGSSYVWTVIGGAKLTGGTTNSITVDWDVAYTAGMVKVVETNTLGCQGDTVFKPIVSIVPVEFLSFDAKRINDKVNLTWVTASEINNSHFEVERSIDNNKFENIGTVKGNGTTSMMNTYKLTDNISKLMNGNATTLYYRLRQVDFDGEFAYTDVRTVELNKLDAASAALSPNPFTDHFNVTINEPKATSAMIQVMDANGKQVRTLSIELNAGTTQYELGQLGDLSSGMYFVQIITASGNSYTIKAIRR